MEFLFKKGVTAFVALMVLVTTQLSFAEDGPDRAAEMGARLAFLQGITDVGLSEDPNMVFSPASMDGLFALIGPG